MRLFFTTLFFVSLTVSGYTTAAKHAATGIRITGKLVSPPPCKVNNNEEILVDFQRVHIRTLEKADIRQDVEIPFVCEQEGDNFQYYLKIDGPRSLFNNKLIKTNQPNLAFYTELAGNRLDYGKPHLVNSRNLTLTMVLTKNPDGALTQGSFSGTGTVTMEYF